MTQPPDGDSTQQPGESAQQPGESTQQPDESAQQQPGQPGHPAPVGAQPGYPPPSPGQPGLPPPVTPAPVRRKGPLIASIALVAALLLCGGGATAAFLLLRNTETGEGAPNPTQAVTAFLTAVYTDQDAKKAAEVVCAAARDQKAITERIEQVKGLAAKYKKPRFTWTSPVVDDQNQERAIVSTKVTMATADEKVSHQELKFTVVQKTGWFVCEVS